MDALGRERRIRNAWLNAYECAAQATVLRSLPVSVMLHTGSRCNFQCIFCTERIGGQHRDEADLSLERFLAHAAPLHRALRVSLYGWSEPLLNPEYPAIFDHVTENHPGIGLSIVTNGSLLNEDWARKLVSYHWTTLTVSVNATDASMHRMLSGSDRFEQVMENLRRVIGLRRAEGRCSPYLCLSFVALVQNIEQLPDFVDMAARLGIEAVVVQNLIVFRKEHEAYSLVHRQDCARRMYREARRRALKGGIALSLFSPAPYFFDEGDHVWPLFCRDPWESFWVRPNGDVCMCCFSRTVMGNLEKQSLEEIWNGERYQYFRRHVNTAYLPEECKECPLKSVHGGRTERAESGNGSREAAGAGLLPAGERRV